MAPEQRPPQFRHEAENALEVQITQIPTELLSYPQWVLWRYVDRGEGRKPDKQPVNPHNLHNAGVHWANTWSTGEHTLATYLQHVGQGIDGVGFVLTRDDPFVGIDIDNCVQEEDITNEAQQVIDHLQSYTEVSPSGHGLRILVSCPEFLGNARTKNFEIYAHSRFLTLTGNHVADTPPNIIPAEPHHLQMLLPKQQMELPRELSKAEPYEVPDNIDAEALWQRIFQHDRYGEQHLQRFQGDISLDNGDHSLTVIRLLNTLARWTQCDEGQMRAMMLMSPLANEKWLSRRGKGDWLDHQIADAIRFVRRS